MKLKIKTKDCEIELEETNKETLNDIKASLGRIEQKITKNERFSYCIAVSVFFISMGSFLFVSALPDDLLWVIIGAILLLGGGVSTTICIFRHNSNKQ